MKPEGIGKQVGNIVYAPTMVAYCWVALGFVKGGIVLYLVFVGGALATGLFDQLSEWPLISKLTLGAGPVLMALGLYFSTIETSYYMLIPTLIYLVLTISAWHALADKFDK